MKLLTSISKKSAGLALAAVLAMAGTSSASALTLTSAPGSNSGTFDFSGTGNGFIFNTSGSITIAALTSNSITVDFTLFNGSTRTDLSQPTAEDRVRLVSFGFGIDPNVTTATLNSLDGAGMLDAVVGNKTPDSIPSLTGIEVCAFSGNSCAAGANSDGILAGFGDTFRITMGGVFNTSGPIIFDPLGVKYQTGNGSTEISCTAAAGCGSVRAPAAVPVPEPASLALLGLGIAAFGMSRRRKS